MRTYGRKVRHVLPPFILLWATVLVVYTALRWTLDLRFHVFRLDEEVLDFWLPFLLPWVFLLTVFRRRFRILTFKRDDDRGRMFVQVICAFTMAGSMVVAQHYLKGTAGGLKDLDTVEQLDPADHVRHFRIARFIVGSWMGGSHGTAHTSGRYNQNLNYQVYVVAPLLRDSSEASPEQVKAWYGVRFHERISNRASDEKKEDAWDDLWERAEAEMEHYDFHRLDHFQRVTPSDDRKGFLEAIASRTGTVTGDEVILVPRHEPFGSESATHLAWVFGALGIGCGLLLLALAYAGLDVRALHRQLRGEGPRTSKNELDDWYTWLLPKRGRITTPILMDVNLLVFLAMVLGGVSFTSPLTRELIAWGANTSTLTPAGQWWRLLTSLFVHAGFIHLVMNLFGLVLAGFLLEAMLGSLRFALFYLASGAVASGCSLWWHDQVVSVGASGAVFGLFGAVIGIALFRKRGTFDATNGVLAFAGLYVGLNLVFGFLIPGIDNAAHIGGLLAGTITGPALFYTYKHRPQEW
ncbi:MAG: rhomboid family intramembrane serine protease [Flavobacteriales bacterium]|nr:rhomboid family intramembrane serine protease [Flavobacteriales bacterium]